MLIRRATEKDAAVLHEWMIEFLEKVLPYKPVDRKHVFITLMDLIDKNVALVADDEGRLKGVVLGMYASHPLNPTVSVLHEIAWWVPEKYRKDGVGGALLDAFSSLKKTDITTMTLIPESEKAGPVLEKLGYAKAELTYVKDNRS